jgi:hypothetical protein
LISALSQDSDEAVRELYLTNGIPGDQVQKHARSWRGDLGPVSRDTGVGLLWKELARSPASVRSYFNRMLGRPPSRDGNLIEATHIVGVSTRQSHRAVILPLIIEGNSIWIVPYEVTRRAGTARLNLNRAPP